MSRAETIGPRQQGSGSGGGGGGGTPPPFQSIVFIQDTQPTVPGPWIWYVTSNGVLVDIVIETVPGA